jgi:acyl-CoA thioesterase FadM
MARVAIDLPETFDFETELEVRIADINYGQHLGNDALLGLVHEARIRFLKSIGLSELDVGGGVGLIMADAAIVFRSQAFHGDRLQIRIAVREIGRSTFDLVYGVTNGDAEVVRVKTGMVCFDYARQVPVRVPASFKDRFPAGQTRPV